MRDLILILDIAWKREVGRVEVEPRLSGVALGMLPLVMAEAVELTGEESVSPMATQPRTGSATLGKADSRSNAWREAPAAADLRPEKWGSAADLQSVEEDGGSRRLDPWRAELAEASLDLVRRGVKRGSQEMWRGRIRRRKDCSDTMQ